tara:strand:- start:6567 stop:7355 length:789 start_codon:yes stop_codon:yes gene_type:complete
MAVGLDYGQMLASINALQSPQTGIRIAQPDFIKSQFAVKKEKQSQQKEFQALMEEELAKASDSGGWGLLGDLGKAISFIPGVGTGLGAGFQALSAAGTASSQKSALEDTLQSSRAFSKYANTWLGDDALAYKQNIKDLAGDIDPLMTGLTTGAAAYGTGKIKGKIGEQFADMFKGDTVLPDVITDTGSSMEITPGETIRGFTEGAGGGIKNLIANIKEGGGIGEGGLKELFSGFNMDDLLGEIDDDTFEKLLQFPAFFQMIK